MERVVSQNHMGRLGFAALLGAVSGPIAQFLALGLGCFGGIVASILPTLSGHLFSRGIRDAGWRQLYAFVYGISGGVACLTYWQLTLDPKDLPGLSGSLAWGFSLVAAFGLWVFAVIGTFIPGHRARFGIPGICRDCGYDLTGNVSGRCPECGRAVNLV